MKLLKITLAIVAMSVLSTAVFADDDKKGKLNQLEPHPWDSLPEDVMDKEEQLQPHPWDSLPEEITSK